jgi:hypothetical protein
MIRTRPGRSHLVQMTRKATTMRSDDDAMAATTTPNGQRDHRTTGTDSER